MNSMDNSKQDGLLIWADKVVLGLAAGLVFLSGIFWLTAFMVIGADGMQHLWSYMGAAMFNYGFLALASVWLCLRTADFAAGGSTYRHAVHAGRVMAAAARQLAHTVAKRTHGPQTARF
jgi:hypothetical protein